MQRFQAIDPLARKSDRGGGDLVLAPMPGMLRAVNVQAGQSVRAGDRLCVLEAMKMEHALRAPRDGVVAKVNVQTGEQVTAQSVLMALEPQA
jgi:3-methylcrotonyl-CoA carboxylase alpha subunit